MTLEGSCETDNPELSLFPDEKGGWRLRTDIFLSDRPGELADVSEFVAGRGANIERFSYNRTQNPYLVHIEAWTAQAAEAGALADDLAREGRLRRRQVKEGEEPDITDPAGLLKIKVALEDKPGTLAAFASILKERGVSVIHMEYDGAADPGVAEMDMAARTPEEVSQLLSRLTADGWNFHVSRLGAEGGPIDDILGLSPLESLLFKLRAILPGDKLSALSDLIKSSDAMRRALAKFKQSSGESGETMAASETFANILRLAASSLGKTGREFAPMLRGPLALSDEVGLYLFACPTGANAYILRHGGELTLVDSGYGLYFGDAMEWLAAHGFDPSAIKRAFFTHSDADHAGFAAPLERRYGTRVYMHPDCRDVFSHENRAHGADTRLTELNQAFTRLINRITELAPPANILPFPEASGEMGGFPVIGRFTAGDLEFFVLESQGGHVTGYVFFFCPARGLLFSGDYLIDFKSLSDREKDILSAPRYLMTSTNKDSGLFTREMRMLGALLAETESALDPKLRPARIFPGHGAFYATGEIE